MTREEAVNFLIEKPYKLGHLVGFTKLTEIHNKWIVDMVRGKEDKTLQAHRSSYKTTCVSIALSLIIILLPRMRTMFMRKTDSDIKEIIRQVRKILESQQIQYFVQTIYGVKLQLTTATVNEISTNLTNDPRGTPQLTGLGTGGSLTGKHFDRIFTDDIVNIQDRVSKAERDRTKIIYQELRNILNRGGRFFNTGTPWHRDDAFSLMPEPEKFDCYSTDLISAEELDVIKHNLTPSLFAANYELRHIAADGQLFTASPKFDTNKELFVNGACQIDAGYGGDDATACTIGVRRGDTIYGYGMKFNKHVDFCLPEILAKCDELRVGLIFCELNGDKGYLVKEIRRLNYRAQGYNESMNKNQKISTHLRKWWDKFIWLEGTSKEYLNDIMDYTEDAEHDDCADSAASLVRYLDKE